MKHVLRDLLITCALLASARLARAQLSAPTVLPGDTTLSPPAGEQTNVVFARGAGATLMVWEDSRAALAGTQDSRGNDGSATRIKDIYAARIDVAGNPIDTAPIRVTTASFSQVVPRAAWNGQNWLVVWTSRTAGPSFSTQGVYATRISATGQILDDPPIVISDTQGFDEREPVVASDGNKWAVIWFANIAFGTDGVRGCLVDAAGTPDAPRNFFLTSPTSGNFYLPFNFELAWAGGRYLFVSEHSVPGPSSDQNIQGQLFDASLTKVAGEFPVATHTPWNQNRAAIASNGTGFFVTWYDEQLPGQVRGSPVSNSGVVAVPDGTVFETGLGVEVHAAAGWDGVNWIATWEKTGSTISETLIRCARVTGAGAMLPGSPFSVSAGNWSRSYPAVATLNGGALVSWSDERNVHFFFSNAPLGIDTLDLYGAVVDVTGSVAPDQSLLFSPPAQTRPDLAGNAASGYLATFLSETAGTASVMAQRVDAIGVPIDPAPVVVATGTRLIRNPAVAFDGTVWLVTWEELNLTGSSGSGNVFARRLRSDGVPIDVTPILVMSGNTPDVAAVGGIFLVVSTTNPSQFQSIHGARVRGSDGALLDTTPIILGTYYSVDPAVTAFADRWFVAWQVHPSHNDPNSRVQANFVLSSGTALGEFQVSTSGRAPSVTSGGSTALVSWNDGSDINARRIQSNGTLLDTSTGFVVSNAFNKQFTPESGWDGTRWFVAWNDYRAHTNLLDGGVGDLYGARVEAGGTVSDPAGLAIANDFAVPEATPAIAGESGTAITAYAMLRVEPAYGTFRITLRAVNGSSAMQTFCFGDGSAAACPCANVSAAGEGCANSSGSGAVLTALGTSSVASDDLRFQGWQLPQSTFALLFQGDNAVSGSVVGDGLLCVSTNLVRLGARPTGANGVATWGPGLAAAGGWTGGQTKHFQAWYRNHAGPCGGGTNMTNGVSVSYSP